MGLHGVLGGQESIKGIIGPLGQSMNDIWTFQKTVMDQQPWDIETSLVPVPWRGEFEASRDITVGIMFDDGYDEYLEIQLFTY